MFPSSFFSPPFFQSSWIINSPSCVSVTRAVNFSLPPKISLPLLRREEGWERLGWLLPTNNWWARCTINGFPTPPLLYIYSIILHSPSLSLDSKINNKVVPFNCPPLPISIAHVHSMYYNISICSAFAVKHNRNTKSNYFLFQNEKKKDKFLHPVCYVWVTLSLLKNQIWLLYSFPHKEVY